MQKEKKKLEKESKPLRASSQFAAGITLGIIFFFSEVFVFWFTLQIADFSIIPQVIHFFNAMIVMHIGIPVWFKIFRYLGNRKIYSGYSANLSFGACWLISVWYIWFYSL